MWSDPVYPAPVVQMMTFHVGGEGIAMFGPDHINIGQGARPKAV